MHSHKQNNDPLLDNNEMADYLNISPGTLNNWRTKGKGPEYLKINGKLVRYQKSAGDRYIKKSARGES